MATNAYLINGVNAITPTGSIVAFMGTTDPDGWIICDGVLRDNSSGKYNALIAMSIGTQSGTNYKPPDLRASFLRGAGTSLAANSGYAYSAASANPGIFQDHAYKDHTHKLKIMNQGYTSESSWLLGTNWDNGNGFGIGGGLYHGSAGASLTPDSIKLASASETNTAAETRPYNMTVNWILKI
jgi:microcystin-dependent protein